MTSLRKKLVWALAVVTMLLTITLSWDLLPGAKDKDNRAAVQNFVSSTLEERSFELQSKLFIGTLDYFTEKGNADPDSRSSFTTLEDQLTETFIEDFLPATDKDTERLLQMRLALALYLDRKEQAREFYSALSRKQIVRPPAEIAGQEETDDAIRAAYQCTRNAKACNVTENDKSVLREQLNWIGDIYVMLVTSDPKESKSLRESIAAESTAVFQKFAVLFTLGTAFAIFSFLTFIVLTFKMFSRTLRFHYRDSGMDAHYSLEIFCLYLLFTLAGNYFMGMAMERFPRFDPLYGNLVMISLMPILIVWPRFFGVPFGAIRERLGLSLKSVGQVLKDILLAPVTYAGSWTILIVVLLVYAGVLVKLGVDVAQGTHPIVPILLSAENQDTFILIAILAVVVAPIVEEIMFRGALYSWLRARLGATLSIISSSLLFALVHPQGPVGVVPLTVIGMVLAFLREWRGSLVAPMVAHGCFNGGTMLLLWLVYH